jgi:uncharacterized protein (TIGR03437 family)
MIFPRALALARPVRRLTIVISLFALLIIAGLSNHKSERGVQAGTRSLAWYKGNTHTHTNQSFDGESPPATIAATYRNLGYNFLYITDHNKLTSVDGVNAQLAVPGRFLVIKGEEVTDGLNGKYVHINALNNSSPVAAQHGGDVLSQMQNNVTAVRQAGGLPYIAHPNFGFSITADDMKNVTGTSLFEVYNAHPIVNNIGDATHPSVEAIWDAVLSSGKVFYGIAADDVHTLVNPAGPLPGRAWVMVRAASLDADSITQAIANGDFYSSTGITLHDYEVSATGITITLDAEAAGATIDFIGRNGQLLQSSTSNPAVYSFTGHEQYVRAKVVDDAGRAAWTQPVFTERLNPEHPISNGASLGHEPGTEFSIAPDSVASASGLGLGPSAIQAQRVSDNSFPTSLGGTSVTVNGRAAEVFYVSSSQVNFHVPEETEPGPAQVVITNADNLQMHSQIMVANAAPGIFTEDGSGTGKAVSFDLDELLGNLLADNDWRRIYFYATGVRGASNAVVLINGQAARVEAIKSCRGLPGLDQITIALPRLLTPPGSVSLVVTADGVSSNPVTLQLK